MPELPEVESIKLQLQSFLVGHAITSITINNPKTFEGDKSNVVGGKVRDIRRFAKVLSIDLDNGNSLVIHIKLTGQLIYRGPNLKNPGPLSKKINGGIPGPHTLVVFELNKSGVLYYNDFRRFGWIKVMKTSDVEKVGFVSKLGPELPVGQSSGGQSFLSQSAFDAILNSTRRAIKVVLMDQSKISGIGNIYANDALWLARIHPARPANSLSLSEQKELYKAIQTVLRKGLKTGGASELSFVTPDGGEGGYQKHFLSYGKQGTLCPNCKKEKFVKTTIAGRGTYHCPSCQKLFI